MRHVGFIALGWSKRQQESALSWFIYMAEMSVICLLLLSASLFIIRALNKHRLEVLAGSQSLRETESEVASVTPP